MPSSALRKIRYGATKDTVQHKANELKSMFTNDGNVLLFNIHVNVNADMTTLIKLMDIGTPTNISLLR